MSKSFKKMRLCISACLLGEKVRYDGGHKLDVHLKSMGTHLIQWIAVCPEKECGLAVPREPMSVEIVKGCKRLKTNFTKQDLTLIMTSWINKKMKELEDKKVQGFVLKSKSPSCGIDDVPIFNQSGVQVNLSSGLFAEVVLKYFPESPVIDEKRCLDKRCWDDFIFRVLAYK